MAGDINVKEIGELYSFAATVRDSAVTIETLSNIIMNETSNKECMLQTYVDGLERKSFEAEADWMDAQTQYEEVYDRYCNSSDEYSEDLSVECHRLEAIMNNKRTIYNEIATAHEKAEALFHQARIAFDNIRNRMNITNLRVLTYAEECNTNIMSVAALLENYKNVK